MSLLLSPLPSSKQEIFPFGELNGKTDMGSKQSTAGSAQHSAENLSPTNFHGLFVGPEKAKDSHEEQKVKTLRRQVMESKSVIMKDTQILYALRSNFSNGDVAKAFDLLLAISNSSEGLVMDYNPQVKLLGAENRQGVTCFLDSILFAMFSRLDSFEAMLYNTFDDVPRSRLALLLRLWVNLLRSGKLITTDITKHIQDSLAECGWEEAATLCQQDASEAFTFITGKLELPLLTLKMDIYHTGKEDVADDHKFINERLLEVAIPSDQSGTAPTVTLEDCLENYFNNRVEVRRFLERRSTLSSVLSHDSTSKSRTIHVETVEVDSDSSPPTPLSSSPSTVPISRPLKHRAPSIIQQRFFPDMTDPGQTSNIDVDTKRPARTPRQGSVRKEVVMPAWQFFSLIPWYTDNAPMNDTQVAAHFSSKRPVLGICLKRYSFTSRGKAIRLNTQIDIPVEIGLPHFIQDDHMEDVGPLYGNFKLLLQSIVCHRGNSVSSGHYISLVRSTNAGANTTAGSSEAENARYWMRLDDLASKRITLVDIEQALKEETPYLLFYQIVPIEGDPGHITDGERPLDYSSSGGHDSGIAGVSMTSLSLKSTREDAPPSSRASFEVDSADSPRGRTSIVETRRTSVTFAEPNELPGELTVPENNSTRPSSEPSSPTRKSPSQTRSGGPTGNTQTKSLSRLTGGKSTSMFSREVAGDPEGTLKEVPIARVDENKGQTVLRKEGRREKSKNRLSKASATSGKTKSERPDRECSVM